MMKRLAGLILVVVLLGLGWILVRPRPGSEPGGSHARYRAVDYQHLVGENRREVEEELALPRGAEWSSMDSFYHGTISQLDLPGMSVVCYGDTVVAVEPNER